jgi:hypothetical protein
MQKRFGTGATYAAGAGAALGYGAGWVGNRAAGAAGKAARGVVRTLAQLCKTNPTHPECNGNSNSNSNSNGNNQNRRQNGRPSRSTAGQPPARYANGNRRGGPKSRSRKGPNQN